MVDARPTTHEVSSPVVLLLFTRHRLGSWEFPLRGFFRVRAASRRAGQRRRVWDAGMSSAAVVEVQHTGRLGPGRQAAARALLYDVVDDMTEPDWEHCLGGMHALAVVDGAVVAHAALVARRLGHHGRPLRAGYVEGVAVHPDWPGRGLGSAVMAPLERMIGDAYEIGALAATDDGARFYAARSWRPWVGRTWALTPTGAVRTPRRTTASSSGRGRCRWPTWTSMATWSLTGGTTAPGDAPAAAHG